MVLHHTSYESGGMGKIPESIQSSGGKIVRAQRAEMFIFVVLPYKREILE